MVGICQNWTVGGRIGSGFQAVGQYVFSNDNYVEARFGAYWANAGGTVTADFSVLYNWNVCNMDWTPSAGRWFFDAGAGINVGGKGHYAYVGVAGSAKLVLPSRGLRYVFRSTGRRLSVPESLIGTGDRIPSSTNGRCATSVLRAFIASKERTRGNKRSPEQFAPGFFYAVGSVLFLFDHFPPLADEERFPRGGIEELNVIWTRNGCGRRRKTAGLSGIQRRV